MKPLTSTDDAMRVIECVKIIEDLYRSVNQSFSEMNGFRNRSWLIGSRFI